MGDPLSPCHAQHSPMLRRRTSNAHPCSPSVPHMLTPRSLALAALRSSNASPRVLSLTLTAFVIWTATPALAFGPSWEGDLINDAKDSAASAQLISTGGAVTNISGTLGGGPLLGQVDFVDMYLIRLENPGILKISTAGGSFGGDAGFDSQLFLFRAGGVPGDLKAGGLLANNDADDGNTGSLIGPAATDGSGFVVTSPGLYFIAISAFGTNPFNSNGDPIWGVLNVPGQIRFGEGGDLAGWSVTGQPAGGSYSIRIEGFSGVNVPAPGALAILALAGLVNRRRR